MIRKYTPEQWSRLNDFPIELNEVAFYADTESAIAGCKYQDGMYGAFGAGYDVKDITYDEMIDYIKAGY